MRISDWSSDVCSSDLRRPQRGVRREVGAGEHIPVIGERALVGLRGRGQHGGEDKKGERWQAAGKARSVARRVGKEGVSTCRARGSPYQYKQKSGDILMINTDSSCAAITL